MDNIDNIERYLKGQLTAEEEKAFREQLKTDKAFRDEVLVTSLMIKQMKQQNQEKERAILEEARKEAAARKRRRWIYRASSIAAVLIIGFFAVKPIYFNYKSDQMISKNYAQWSPREEGTTKGASRGVVQAGENVVAELSELFDNVGKDKNIKTTIERLEQMQTESETDYYEYYPDIVWYLALAYVQEKQFDKVSEKLDAIIENGESDYLDRAKKMKNEIENMYFM